MCSTSKKWRTCRTFEVFRAIGLLFAGCYFLLPFSPVNGFNVDLNHPLVSSGAPDSYFGFSVGLTKSNGQPIVIVGAPKANSTFDTNFQPGAIYACAIGQQLCQELDMNRNNPNEIVEASNQYAELRNNSWLGVSVDVSPDDSQFVACGHLWKDMRYELDYLTNGVCYLADTGLNLNARPVRRLLPLVQRDRQVENREYIYALGLAGMSVHYPTDDSNLLIGAPGAYQMSGTLVVVPEFKNLIVPMNQRASRPQYTIPIPNLSRSEDSYFGYSMTSGKFYSNKPTLYASGAPRQGINGMVFIYTMNEDPNNEVAIQAALEGSQMGEYFGASLCATDLNNDGFADLIVGAPLYSTYREEGRIYVFMSDGKYLVQTATSSGSSTEGARFGTAIASIGDINSDSYQDIAVGAPYEQGGVVYIYHGNSKGLKTKASQRIAASSISNTLRGFGMSIAKGKDIDENFYPDLAIGASISSNVVILRTKPIIKLIGKLSFDTVYINTDLTNCTENGVPVTCFQLNLCTEYQGQHASNTLDVVTSLNLDILKSSENQNPRVHFFNDSVQQDTFSFVWSLTKNTRDCRSFPLFVKKNIVDFLTPVKIQMSYHLKDDARVEFCKNCPIIDTESSGNVTNQLSFYTGCGEDNQCIADLQLMAKIGIEGSNDLLILGSQDSLQLDIELINVGDPAFQTQIRIEFPKDVDYIRMPIECSPTGESHSGVVLLCNLGNPLESMKMVPMRVDVDLRRLTSETKLLQFNINATTTSDEDPKSKDNFVSLTLPVKAVADMTITGQQFFEENYFYNKSKPGVVPITHLYEVSKYEASPVKNVMVEFKFPIATGSKLSFTRHPFTLEVFYNYRVVPSNLCVSSVTEPVSNSLQHVDMEFGSAVVVDCNTMSCHTVKCRLGPFVKRETVSANITAFIDLTTLLEAVNNETLIQLRSTGSVMITEEFEGTQPENNKPDYVTVIANFIPIDLKPQPLSIPWWIILLAVIGGIVLLAVLIGVLYKFGFFKREEHEKLLHEAALDNENNGTDLDAENENFHLSSENETS